MGSKSLYLPLFEVLSDDDSRAPLVKVSQLVWSAMA